MAEEIKKIEGPQNQQKPEEVKKIEGPKQNNNKQRKMLLLLTAAFLLIALCIFAYWWWWLRFEEYTDDAYVDGNQIMITPQISAMVTSIYADNTDFVQEEQLLVQLDPTDYRIALQTSIEELALSVRSVIGLFENVKQLEAEVEGKHADFVTKAQDYEHRKALIDTGSISLEDLEHAQAYLEEAFASMMQSEYKLQAAEAEVANTTVRTHPRVLEAADRLRQNWVNLSRCKIYAPASGLVAQRTIQVGEWVNQTDPLLSIVPLEQMWITANFKEVQLSDLRIGQPVEIKADMYGSSVIYHGKVVGLTPGTGSVFSVLPPQNATGNWIKIVQRLPVRISLDPEELKAHPLMLGLSVEVTVDLHDMKGARLPASKPVCPLYSTNVFDYQEEGVDAFIEEIILENMGPELVVDNQELP